MKGEYLREGRGSFLRLPGPGAEADREEAVELQMLCRGGLPGLLKASVKHLNGEEYLYYEVGSLVRLEDLYLKKRMGREDIQGLMEKLVQQERALEDYLLDDTHLMLDPGMIYSDLSTGEFRFVLYPGLEGEREEQYGMLVEFLIKAADYEDEELIEAVYALYDLVMNRAFSPARAAELLKELSGKEKEEKGEAWDTEAWGADGEEDREEKAAQETAWMQKESLERRDGFVPSRREREEEESVTDLMEEDFAEHAEKKPFSRTLLKLSFIPVVLLELFFGWIFVNVSLNQKEMLLLGAGAASALAVGVICRLLLAKLEREEKEEEEDGDWEPEKEIFPGEASGRNAGASFGERMKRQRAESAKGAKLPPGDMKGERLPGSVFSEEGGKTEYFQPEEHTENKLYGLGKNRRVIRLENLPFVVGKSKEHVDYLLQDNSVSRMHAKFTDRDGKIYLTDLNSTNGTFKNGLRLNPGEATLLEREDEVRLGRLEFAFR